MRLLNLKDLVSLDINENAFYDIQNLLSERGYYRRGKHSKRLNLLHEEDLGWGVNIGQDDDQESQQQRVDGLANDQLGQQVGQQMNLN